jgi:hypothetical protein
VKALREGTLLEIANLRKKDEYVCTRRGGRWVVGPTEPIGPCRRHRSLTTVRDSLEAELH